MGGRSAFLSEGGFSEYRYDTLSNVDTVRIIIRNDNQPVSSPLFSNSPNAIYATVQDIDNKLTLKCITFYDDNRRQVKTIDFLHGHGTEQGPHVHLDREKNTYRKINNTELDIIQKIVKELMEIEKKHLF
jgi:hypothetical protein